MSEAFIPDYYMRHDEVALRLGNKPVADVIKLCRAGEFGKDLPKDGRYFLVPAAGFKSFLQARQIFDERGELKPVHARTPGELRRKLAARSS